MENGTETDGSVITPEQRIQELNDLDTVVVKMLSAMGRAVKVISARDDNSSSLEERRKIFQESLDEAFSHLAAIDVGQRRSIFALSEAGIIDGSPVAQSSQKPTSMLGNLDISVLNSQNDKVGKEIEAEQWAKIREILEQLKEAGLQWGPGSEPYNSTTGTES